ncbi:hypothetical protein [Desulfoscipio geothermicus]|uniref:DUF4878 domain-containing protein n=1 Tax=Desulfoscipio geothermicus DSM 3669 TaxID=1121426 RepID=A0A1I6DNR6_9FIRM|nr:hypothetical protein [Desulfoscipio geothermicus]SFR07095.1 hypothetical protein SAMN05660706_11438 [Desulfoscipio geothermicus DSM 3669]
MKRALKITTVLIVALSVFAGMTGCAKSENPKKLSPGQAFTIFMENMRQGNYTEAAQFVSLKTAADNQTDLPTFLAWMAGKQELDKITGVKMLSEKVDGTKAIVKVELTAEFKGKKASHEMEVPMTKEDGIWKLYLDAYGNPKE